VFVIKVLATILPAFAVFLTTLRLYYRWSRRHLGYDDAWAAFAVFCAFFMTAGAWTRSDTPATGPFHHSLHVRIIGYYMLNVSFTCVLWASRMSILFSIIRLIPYLMAMRIHAYICAILFGMMWVALIIQKLVVCETNTAWKHLPGAQCVLGHSVGGLELATDFLADIILVYLPAKLLWNIKLSFTKRVLLMGIFSASMFTTVVSVIHGVYVFSENRNAEGILAHIEASTALMVCNLAVLVPWLSRAFGHRGESEGSPTPGTSTGASPAKDLTTLRFYHPAPIVLHALELDSVQPSMARSVHTCASGEEIASMTFADNSSHKSLSIAEGEVV
ncbi:hypothetical protein C8Q79DRAFT_909611, partial [Trametes meyenii]